MPWIFMTSNIITSIMLFTQAIIILHVARENFIVFAGEHSKSNISKALEKEKHGLKSKNNMQQKKNDGTESGDLDPNQDNGDSDGQSAI